jgi:[protein-PII] uridylyltransferase
MLLTSDLRRSGRGRARRAQRVEVGLLITHLYDHTLDAAPGQRIVPPTGRRRQRLRRAKADGLLDPGPPPRRRSGLVETQVIVACRSSYLLRSSRRKQRSSKSCDRLRSCPADERIGLGPLSARTHSAVEYTIGTYEAKSPPASSTSSDGRPGQPAAADSLGRHSHAGRWNGARPLLCHDRDQDANRPAGAGAESSRSAAASWRRSRTPAASPPCFAESVAREIGRSGATSPAVKHRPRGCTFDNATAAKFTILAIFRLRPAGPAVFHRPQRSFELGLLRARKAKIGTHLDQVVDVFYVTDQRTGAKITDDKRLADIHRRLLAAMEEPT